VDLFAIFTTPKAKLKDGMILINHAAILLPLLVDEINLKTKNIILMIAPNIKCIKKLTNNAFPYCLNKKLNA
jgi:hypothetical protein